MARTDISYNNIATESNQFDRLGFPGKYYSALTFSGGQLDLTGSNYGYGAFLRSGSSQPGNITIAPGNVQIAIENFEEKRIYEISVSQISGSNAGKGEVYFFKRQQ